MIAMEIEFDPVKNEINLEKHGIGLDAALPIFATPSVEWPSLDKRHGESRYIAVGLIDGAEFTCIFTVRGPIARIISVRRSRDEERDRFWKVRRTQIRPPDSDA
jgi:uncharacterized DUF497 family protein